MTEHDWTAGHSYVFTVDEWNGMGLSLGVPKGEQRPAIGVMTSKGQRTLGRFYSNEAADVALRLLFAYTDRLNQAIDYYDNLIKKLEHPHQGEADSDK